MYKAKVSASFGVVIALGLLLAACAAPPAETPLPPTAEPTVAPTATTEPNPTAVPTPAVYTLTIEQMEYILVQSSDFGVPHDLIQSTVLDPDLEEAVADGSRLIAGYLEGKDSFLGLLKAYRARSANDLGETTKNSNFLSRIIVFASPEEAAEYMQDHVSLFRLSTSSESWEPDFLPIEFVELGDETIAYSATDFRTTVIFDVWAVSFRQGNVVVGIHFFTREDDEEAEDVERLMRVMETRLLETLE